MRSFGPGIGPGAPWPGDHQHDPLNHPNEDDALSDALWLARVTLAAPYPPDIFTPLSQDELRICVAALTACNVRNASARLHARWARHLFDVAERIEADAKDAT